MYHSFMMKLCHTSMLQQHYPSAYVICHAIESVNISKVAVIPVDTISGLAFVFLSSNITEHKFHIQGMQDAYLVRFIFLLESNELLELNSSTFFPFPDLYQEHNMKWCNCLTRLIFTSIEEL
jgi:hypothetical protein